MVVRMQEMMCFYAVRFTEPACIKFLYVRIFMRTANRCIFIDCIQPFCTSLTNKSWFCLFWLTATADTTARASHDFDEVVIAFTGTKFIHQLTCIAKTAGNCNLDRTVIDCEGSFFDTFHTAYFGEIEFFELFTRDFSNDCTKSRFHNTTGYAEDACCTGRATHRAVEFFFRKIFEVNTSLLNHRCQLCRCNNAISASSARRMRALTIPTLPSKRSAFTCA